MIYTCNTADFSKKWVFLLSLLAITPNLFAFDLDIRSRLYSGEMAVLACEMVCTKRSGQFESVTAVATNEDGENQLIQGKWANIGEEGFLSADFLVVDSDWELIQDQCEAMEEQLANKSAKIRLLRRSKQPCGVEPKAHIFFESYLTGKARDIALVNHPILLESDVDAVNGNH